MEVINRVQVLKIHDRMPEELRDEKIKSDLLSFIQHINKRHPNANEQIKNLLLCRRVLEGLIVLIQNISDPKGNQYVEDYKEEYYLLVANIGRWSKKVDQFTEELIKSFAATSERVRDLILQLKIKNYEQLLIEGIENLITRPLMDASEKYSLIKINEAKTVQLFNYFVFYNLVTTSFIMGVVTREETGMRKKAGVNEIVPPKIPTPLPQGIREVDEDGDFEKSNEDIEEYFSEEHLGVDDDY